MKTINSFKHIQNKVILSGNILEVFTYENGYSKGLQSQSKSGRASKTTTDETKKENREKVMYRARSRVRRLANANPQLNKFFTLTFKENLTDLKYTNNEYKKFVLRLNRFCKNQGYGKLEYIAVVEFQKRGAIHYHILCNLPYINAKTLAEIWGNGFIKINKIDSVDNVGAYITKYMTKGGADDRLIENRSFFTSQGLTEPTEIENCENISSILDKKEVVRKYETTFENDYLGKVGYTQYVLVNGTISHEAKRDIFQTELRKTSPNLE